MVWTFMVTRVLATFDFLVVGIWTLCVILIFMSDTLLLGKSFRTGLAALIKTCDEVWDSVTYAVSDGMLADVHKEKNYRLYRIICHLW